MRKKTITPKVAQDFWDEFKALAAKAREDKFAKAVTKLLPWLPKEDRRPCSRIAIVLQDSEQPWVGTVQIVEVSDASTLDFARPDSWEEVTRIKTLAAIHKCLGQELSRSADLFTEENIKEFAAEVWSGRGSILTLTDLLHEWMQVELHIYPVE